MRQARWRSNAFTRLVGVDVPIVLGAFGGASSTELVATVSNSGGLGSYGAYGLSGERILQVADELRGKTDRPFALNVWVPREGDETFSVSQSEFERHLAPLEPYFQQLGVPLPQRPERLLPPHPEQVDAVLEARPAVFSFTYGAPQPDVLDRAKALGIVTMGIASTPDEAVHLERAGFDVIVASGLEAGGHRVSFLKPAEDSLIGNLALIPRVVDAVSVPVVAAGGIADARGIAAVMTLGAQAAQLGTAFLATRQSAASAVHREQLFGPDAGDTVLTKAFSGRLARGIRNDLSRAVHDGRLPIAPFPLQGWLLGKLKQAAVTAGRSDVISLWAGQAAPLLRERDAEQLMTSLVEGVDELLG